MSPFSYRIWDIRNKRYLIGAETDDFVVTSAGQLCKLDLDNRDIYGVEDNYICQFFTGLFDKNKTKVYEGDIVYAKLNNAKYLVCFGEYEDDNDSKHYGYYIGREGKEVFQESIGDSDLFLEVIGNVYENSNLLWTTIKK